MVKVLPYTHLLKMADAIGIHLEETSSSSNLYVMVDPDGNNLYIGKASHPSRHSNEDRWAKSDHTTEILASFITMYRENNASRKKILYMPEKFDFDKAAQFLGDEEGKWSGPALDKLAARIEEQQPPTLNEVEEALIRIHNRTGRALFNSQYMSQWERPIGRIADTLAVLAADYGRSTGLI